jgi:hypothetical protein
MEENLRPSLSFSHVTMVTNLLDTGTAELVGESARIFSRLART